MMPTRFYEAVLLILVTVSIVKSDDWDYFIFSQKWPITFCIHYEKSNKHKCIIPEEKTQWTIHGVWPSKFGGEGPFFCNKTATFDLDKISMIRGKLEKFWANLESDKSTESLWKHEWLKHGTCSVTDDLVSNEKKYFQQGLTLYAMHNMTSLFPKLKIYPEDVKEYNVMHIIDQIQKSLKMLPYISCVTEKENHKSYLFEVRLCFDKGFEKIDCEPHMFYKDHLKKESHSLTNCPVEGTVLFPQSLPNLKKKASSPSGFKKH